MFSKDFNIICNYSVAQGGFIWLAEYFFYDLCQIFCLFACGTDDRSDFGEGGRPFWGTESARNFHFDFDVSNVTFRLVVVKGYVKIGSKSGYLRFVIGKTFQ